MVKKTILNDRDQNLIQKAVEDAERQTTGEIVTVIARRSGDYSAASLVACIVFGCAVQWAAAFAWPALSFASLASIQAISFLSLLILLDLTGWLLPFLPHAWKRKNVRELAERQFIENNLHATKDRAAVLIVVSMDERCVEILADAGIAEKAGKQAWDPIAQTLAAGFKSASPGSAIAEAVAACAVILKNHYPANGGDMNELSDRPIELH